jgi:hypothetical protein
MLELTRRSFLTHASIGLAGGTLVGGLTGLPGLAALPLGGMALPARAAEPVQGLIAHVRNVATGEIAVMVGTREVIHRDRALAVRLLDIAGQSAGR